MERLRWVLLAGGVLLVGVVAGFVAYGRWRAEKVYEQLVRRSGVHLTRQANGFTYSQSVKGKTLFTIHAAKAVQRADGVWTLHDADLTLYGRTSDRVDHIYGASFEYDPKLGVARALGEVHMDLQAPQALLHPSAPPQAIRGRQGRAPSAPQPAGESTQTIHVRTSGLVYTRSEGIAETKEDVEFRYGDIEAHAHGAVFDEAGSTVHLLADVRMDGEVRGTAVRMEAAKADLDRANDLMSLASPVLHASGRTMSAATAAAQLRKDGSMKTLHAAGDVTMRQGTERVRGDELDAVLNARSSPETAVLNGHVTMQDDDPARPMQAQAQRVNALFNADGSVRTLTGHDGVSMASRVKGTGGDWLQRRLTGDVVTMHMLPGEETDEPVLKDMHVSGHAALVAESDVMRAAKPGAKPALAGRKTTSLLADDLNASFAEGAAAKEAQVQRLVGTGHARLLQTGTDGAHTESLSQMIAMDFAPRPADAGKTPTTAGAVDLREAVESGDVHVCSQAANTKQGKPGAVTTAGGARAVFDGVAETLRLSGAAHLEQAGVQTAAQVLTLQQVTGDATAEGNVMTTLLGSGPGQESSHVMAARATLTHASNVAVFTGTDAAPAKLWQGASQVRAATITMDGTQSTLSAKPESANGRVSAVFAGQSAAPVDAKSKPAKPGSAHVAEVSSRSLEYSDKKREAVFSEDVAMHAAGGDVYAQRAVVFLKPKPVKKADAAKDAAPSRLPSANPAAGGQVDRIVATGSVHMQQPGRRATGEQLVYVAATDEFVLTGTPSQPPQALDAAQGHVTGTTLQMNARDNTVVVSGDGKRARVRTETDVKP